MDEIRYEEPANIQSNNHYVYNNYVYKNMTYVDENIYEHLKNALFKNMLNIEDAFYKMIKKTFKKTIQQGQEIPMISHGIWFTSKNNPKEILPKHLETLIRTIHKLDEENPNQWTHILWVNDKNLIPQTIEQLKNVNIQIREIHEVAGELKQFDLIENSINLKLWGMASELGRYAILQLMGGVYCDLNYEIKQSPKEIMDNYSVFMQAQSEHINVMHVENYILGTQANHPLLNRIFEIIEMLEDFIKNNITAEKLESIRSGKKIISTYNLSNIISFESFYLASMEYFFNNEDMWIIQSVKKSEEVLNDKCWKYDYSEVNDSQQSIGESSINPAYIMELEEPNCPVYYVGEDDRESGGSWVE